MARRTCLAVFLTLAALLSEVPATVVLPNLKFGMTVAPRDAGLAVVAIDEDAPVGEKLQVGDVIVSYRVLGMLARPTSVRTNDQLEDAKKLLSEDKPVEITLLRPNSNEDPNPRYQQLAIVLQASDFLREKVERTYSVTVQAPAAGPPEDRDTHVLMDVYYATDRRLENGQYSGAMDLSSSPTKLGVCRVSIPKSRDIGSLPRPSWWPTEWREDPAKHMLLKSVSQFDRDELFFESISDMLRRSDGKRRALLYVHGYNNDFEEAALRTAQLHYDLGFPGVSCFFSWPSDGTMSGYKADEEDVQVAVPHIQNFITDLESRSDIDEIVILAHSMGNRGVTSAIADLASIGGGKKIRELVLAAPDINATVFNRQIAPKLTKSVPRITLYASGRDRALALSDWLGGYSRAGEMENSGRPAVTPLSNLDVLDVSLADADLWGHSAYGDSPTVLHDLGELILDAKNADRRSMLAPVNIPEGRFYRLKSK